MVSDISRLSFLVNYAKASSRTSLLWSSLTELPVTDSSNATLALIDGRIRFYELPQPPHGEIIGDLVQIISNQGPNGLPVLVMVGDNGIHSW